MATYTFWNTLSTQDIERARAFYTALGFTVADMPGGAGGITVRPGDATLLCLFPEQAFAGMIPGTVCDPARAQELVQSLSTDSKEAVDDLAAKAKEAGGTLLGEPKQEPWGYGCGFTDPDGHVWSVMWMPQQG